MEDIGLNLLGSYGSWGSARMSEKPPKSLSFCNPRWKSVDEWKQKARAKITGLLGMPHLTKASKIRTLKKYEYDGLNVEELCWTLPYGPPTHAFFLKPAGATEPLPGILALHDHGGVKYFGKSKIVQTSKRVHPFIKEHQDTYYGGVPWANEIAKQGYGVLVHDVFPFESRKIHASELPSHAVRRMMTPPLVVREVEPGDLAPQSSIYDYDVSTQERVTEINAYNAFGEQHEHIIAKSLFSSGLTWPGVFLAEDRFALNYLVSRPDINGRRVGCCGLSGGGLRTNYLAGIDERILCSVTAGFMTTWRDFVLNVNYTHTWMVYIPLLPRYMDFPEILGLRAPLPSLVLATREDPLFTTAEAERAGRILSNMYKKVHSPETFRISFHEGSHKFDREMQSEAWDWMEQWLKRGTLNYTP